MDLQFNNTLFIVCGASSGFGRAIAETLLNEGASVIGVARREEKLEELKSQAPDRCNIIAGDVALDDTHDRILDTIGSRTLTGLVLNSGGPPPGPAETTETNEWDEAYQNVFRWKTELTRRVIPLLKQASYGRILFVESQSVKQPIANLAQSNAMRAAVAGYAKTLSQEVAGDGITVNLLAPGSHNTPAIERVIQSRQESWNVSYEEARTRMEANVPVGRFGEAEELASLAAWLLSGHSGYVTGQVISHDGGNIAGMFG